MKKTYLLAIEGKNRDRLLEAVKHDIRKYVKRERGRALPGGVDFWDFQCKLGAEAAAAQPVHFAALIPAVDELAKTSEQLYVEVVTTHGHRTRRPTADTGSMADDA